MEFSKERYTTPEEEADEGDYGLTLEEKYAISLERSAYKSGHIAEQDERLGEDHLTGLKNRRALEKELDHMVEVIRSHGSVQEHRASGEPLREFSLLYIDLDKFKQVNDMLSHAEGDKVLKGVAGVLKSSVREADIVARPGGDEFCVLLPRAGAEEAVAIANKICANLRKDSRLHELGVTASIGIYSMDKSNATDSEKVMLRADVAAKKAKQSGGDKFWVYQEGDEL